MSLNQVPDDDIQLVTILDSTASLPPQEWGAAHRGGDSKEALLVEEAKMQEELAEMYFTPDKSRQREVGPGREGVWPGEGGLKGGQGE